jgi:hypothetical protein
MYWLCEMRHCCPLRLHATECDHCCACMPPSGAAWTQEADTVITVRCGSPVDDSSLDVASMLAATTGTESMATRVAPARRSPTTGSGFTAAPVVRTNISSMTTRCGLVGPVGDDADMPLLPDDTIEAAEPVCNELLRVNTTATVMYSMFPYAGSFRYIAQTSFGGVVLLLLLLLLPTAAATTPPPLPESTSSETSSATVKRYLNSVDHRSRCAVEKCVRWTRSASHQRAVKCDCRGGGNHTFRCVRKNKNQTDAARMMLVTKQLVVSE